MVFDSIDFKSGKVCFCSDCLDEEDILQVEYLDGYILDLGWYGEERGFQLYLIENCKWERPVITYRFFQAEQVKEVLETAIDEIERRRKGKSK